MMLTSYSTDLEAGSNLGWKLSLRAGQNDIDELLRGRDWRYLFPRSLHLAGVLCLVAVELTVHL